MITMGRSSYNGILLSLLVSTTFLTVTGEMNLMIVCPENKQKNTNSESSSGTVTWTQPTITNPTGAPTISCDRESGSLFIIGTTEVTCTVTDGAGNKAMCMFHVVVIDNQNPTINKCPENVHVSIDLDDPQFTSLETVATWDVPTAFDNSGKVVTIFSTHESGEKFPVGDTTVMYTAMDGAGNVASCSFDVNVFVRPPSDDFLIESTMGACLTLVWPETGEGEDYKINVWKGGPKDPPSSSSQQYGETADRSNTYIKHEICNLDPGNLYTVQVDSESSEPIQRQMWTVPNQVEDLNVVPGSLLHSSVEVSWQPGTHNAEQYFVEYSNGRSEYVAKTINTIMIDSLYPGNNTVVTVSAVVGSGKMRLTGPSRTLPIITVQLRDSELIVYNYTESTIALAWQYSDNVMVLEPHVLFISSSGTVVNYIKVGPNDPEQDSGRDPRQVEFRGLKPNTKYSIQLFNNPMAINNLTTQQTRPGRVTNIRPTEVMNSSITLEWDPPIEGIVHSYEVYISPWDSSEAIHVDNMSTSHTFNDLTYNTEYFFKIVSIYDGMKSVPQTLTVTAGVTKPSAPSSSITRVIVIGSALGALVLVQLIAIIVICIKYRRLQGNEGNSTTQDQQVGQTNKAFFQDNPPDKLNADDYDGNYEVAGAPGEDRGEASARPGYYQNSLVIDAVSKPKKGPDVKEKPKIAMIPIHRK